MQPPKLSPTPKMVQNSTGLWVPKSSVSKPRKDPALEKTIGVYVDYPEIYYDTPHAENTMEILINELKSFDFRDLLQGLAKLNYFLSDGYTRVNKLDLQLIDDFFPKLSVEHERLVIAFANKRKIFFRQQVLGLVKLNLLHNNFKKGKKLIKNDLKTFGRLLLRITGFTESETNAALEKAKTQEEHNEILTGSIMRNMSFNSSQQFRYTIIRYWTLYNEIANQVQENKYPIHERFREIARMDLDYYMALSFAIRGHYMNAKETVIEKPGDFLIGAQFFKNIKAHLRRQTNRLLNELSATKRDFVKAIKSEKTKGQESFFSYQCFWKKPLFKLHGKAYFLVDDQFLEEKLTFGVFGLVRDHFLDKENKASTTIERKRFGQERNMLNAFMGRCVEIYLNDLSLALFK